MFVYTTGQASSCLIVCLHVSERLPHTRFHEIYLEFLIKSVNTFQIWLKQDKNTKPCVWQPIYIHDLSSRLAFIFETDCVLYEVCAKEVEPLKHWGSFVTATNCALFEEQSQTEVIFQQLAWLTVITGKHHLRNTNWNSPSYGALMIFDSQSVAKFLRNHSVCQNNECFPRKLFTNLKPKENKWKKSTGCVLLCWQCPTSLS